MQGGSGSCGLSVQQSRIRSLVPERVPGERWHCTMEDLEFRCGLSCHRNTQVSLTDPHQSTGQISGEMALFGRHVSKNSGRSHGRCYAS